MIRKHIVILLLSLTACLSLQLHTSSQERGAELKFNKSSQRLSEKDPNHPNRFWKKFIRDKGKQKPDSPVGRWIYLAPVIAIHPPHTVHRETLHLKSDGTFVRQFVLLKIKRGSGMENPQYDETCRVKEGHWVQTDSRVQLEVEASR